MMRFLRGAALCSAFLLGCGDTPPGEWHQEAGFRWRELGGAGRGTDGFTRLAPAVTGVAFANLVSDSAAFRNRHLMHGSGVAIGDVDGDGRPDIYLSGIEGPNALYLNQGGLSFREAAAERGVALGDRPSTGAVFADTDGDGDLDLFVTSMGGANALFRNDGTGRFSDATAQAGFAAEGRGSTTATFADVDGDGDLDLYVANYKARTMLDSLSPQQRAFDQVVKQIGGAFEVVPERRADYRLLRREDINGIALIQRADPDWFYLNDGTGRFVREPIAGNPRFLDDEGKPLAVEPDDFGLSARFYDVTGDGAPDLYVANDFEDPDQFWINDGLGRFRLIAKHAVRRTANSNMAVDFADIDRDGAVDIFQVDMLANDGRLKTQIPTHTATRKPVGDVSERGQWQRNALLLNRGDGTFAEIADAAGVAASGWSWSTLFLDVDLDGFEDLLIGNGHTWDLMDADAQEKLKSTWTGVDWRKERQFYPALALPNVAFRNTGNRTFEDAGARWRFGVEADISHGMATGDLDGDGDLDVVINRLNAGAAVLRNDARAPRIAVRLKGTAPNGAGIGARIRVVGGPVREQSREVTAGGLYLSGADQTYAFAAPADSAVIIEVRWRDGRSTRITDVRAGRLYEIAPDGGEPGAGATASPPPLFQDRSAAIQARHTDLPFNDYLRQPLLGHQLSHLGPGVSWLDIDGDGDDDLVVPDGAGGELAWYRNDGGRFTRVPTGIPARGLDFTMALQYPGPRRAALLVGRSSYRAGSPAEGLAAASVARLDIGPGAGRPAAVTGPDRESIGPMALADIDGDGDLDLFVGNRVLPGAYPMPASSHLYRNESGTFVLDAANAAVLRLIGMASAALFSDLDGDGDPDLAVAVDWGPVKVLLNDRGRLADATDAWGLSRFTGGWKGLTAGDFDGDGRIDLVATNWGTNVPFAADSAAPLYAYVGQFGRGEIVDLLEARYDVRLKAIAPIGPFSRLAWTMPDLRRRIPTFAEYANSSIEKVLGDQFERATRIQITTLRHTLFRNLGGRFEATPLPEEAQYAPAFAAVVADFNGDGREDLYLAQNFSQTEIATPKFDAGRGLLLTGDGAGQLTPMPGQRSGVLIYGDQRGAAASDYDGDGRTDLAVGQNAGPLVLLKNVGAIPGLRVRLVGAGQNPAGIGASMRVRYADGDGPIREVRAGSNYWSSDGVIQVLGLRGPPRSVWLRWAGGKTVEAVVPAGAKEMVIRE
ncbi:MAG: VCBS repeat-containing protein [Gemmatimonadales bacterium]|nr:VCBS repeat-containing protein [Gemmatimonadales bacterium]